MPFASPQLPLDKCVNETRPKNKHTQKRTKKKKEKKKKRQSICEYDSNHNDIYING